MNIGTEPPAASRSLSTEVLPRSAEVLRAFLKLGLVSFGGPVAHIGYFREEFVVRRRWIDDSTFSDLVALCHFLPGPASSQLGLSIGRWRVSSSLAETPGARQRARHAPTLGSAAP